MNKDASIISQKRICVNKNDYGFSILDFQLQKDSTVVSQFKQNILEVGKFILNENDNYVLSGKGLIATKNKFEYCNYSSGNKMGYGISWNPSYLEIGFYEEIFDYGFRIHTNKKIEFITSLGTNIILNPEKKEILYDVDGEAHIFECDDLFHVLFESNLDKMDLLNLNLLDNTNEIKNNLSTIPSIYVKNLRNTINLTASTDRENNLNTICYNNTRQNSKIVMTFSPEVFEIVDNLEDDFKNVIVDKDYKLSILKYEEDLLYGVSLEYETGDLILFKGNKEIIISKTGVLKFVVDKETIFTINEELKYIAKDSVCEENVISDSIEENLEEFNLDTDMVEEIIIDEALDESNEKEEISEEPAEEINEPETTITEQIRNQANIIYKGFSSAVENIAKKFDKLLKDKDEEKEEIVREEVIEETEEVIDETLSQNVVEASVEEQKEVLEETEQFVQEEVIEDFVEKVNLDEVEILEECEKTLPTDNKLTAEDELNSVVGLASVKKQILRYKKLYSLDPLDMHMVFAGNSGTEKEKVARITGRILYENNILPTQKFVLCDREQLLSNVKELVKEARGGILYVKEAHTLCYGNEDISSKEVVSFLAKSIDVYKDFCLILAGNTKEMDEFLNANIELKSRVLKYVHFEDYNDSDLKDGIDSELRKYELHADEAVINRLTNIMIYQRDNAAYFSNMKDIKYMVRYLKMLSSERSSTEVTDSDISDYIKENTLLKDTSL